MNVSTNAPAKIILLGEHAVVYSQPALAIPVSSLRAQVTIIPNDPPESVLKLMAGDLVAHLPLIYKTSEVRHTLLKVIQLVQQHAKLPLPDATLYVESTIPIASGLGSGAAVSTALTRALFASMNFNVSNEAINEIVFEVEKHYHGTPSGIDNTVIVYEQPLFYVRNQPMETITVGETLTFLIADTGVGASTKVAVSAVRDLVTNQPAEYEPIVEQIGSLVKQARQAIEEGDALLLGSLMNKNHTLLQILTVSSPELDQLVQVAQSHGALGAKLSGGGRGGNMIALVTPNTVDEVREALLNAGAKNIYETQLKATSY